MGKKNKERGIIRWSQLRQTLAYVYPYFRRYKRGFALMVVLMLVASPFEPVAAIAAKYFVDYVLVKPEFRMVVLLSIAVVLLFALREGSDFLYKYQRERVCLRVVQDIRIGIYDHFIHLSLDHFDRGTTGDMVSRTTNDVGRMQNTVPLMLDLARQIIKLIALIGVCIYRDPTLTLIGLVIIPLTLGPVTRIGTALKRYTKKGLSRVADLTQHLQETYSGAKVVKAFNMEDAEVDKFRGLNFRLFHVFLTYERTKLLISPITNMVGAVGIAAIFFFGSLRIITGEIEVGDFVSYLMAIGLMYGPIRQIGDINGNLQTAYGAAQRVLETLEKESTVKEAPEAVDLLPLQREIRYENVAFKYGNEYVLRDFNLVARKGELIALVGVSGSGKTTVVNLLPRFYDLQEGRIIVDGVDIREASLQSLRQQIGVVTQETFLFNDTVANNIKYGSPERTQAEVEEAAKAANAHDFIVKLPQGYNTGIGERGVRLSGGQRQRLAIARALLKNPPILILDEATSALDTEAEREVQKALDLLMQRRTTFAIAHRLSTIRRADKILVMEDGRVVEQGTHEELISRDGVYKRLYDMQFFLGEYETDGQAQRAHAGKALLS
jgi:subfamily B ATP-binding cassette protein MsbA